VRAAGEPRRMVFSTVPAAVLRDAAPRLLRMTAIS
jgi:hypothetical protein